MYFLHPYLSNFHQIYWYKLYLSNCHQPQTTSTEWHNQTKIIQISLLAWMYIFLIVLYLSRPIFTGCISMVHIDSNISNTNSYSRVSFEPENQVRCDRISRPDLCKVLIPIVLKLINFEDFSVFKVEDCKNSILTKHSVTLTMSSTPSPWDLNVQNTSMLTWWPT